MTTHFSNIAHRTTHRVVDIIEQSGNRISNAFHQMENRISCHILNTVDQTMHTTGKLATLLALNLLLDNLSWVLLSNLNESCNLHLRQPVCSVYGYALNVVSDKYALDVTALSVVITSIVIGSVLIHQIVDLRTVARRHWA